jgi:chaperonin GroES
LHPGTAPYWNRPSENYNQLVDHLEEAHSVSISLEPLDDYVVVEPVDEETETRTGLIIPASAEAHCRSGIVTATGPEAAGVEPGDKVLFPKGTGFDVRLAGVAVKVLKRADLIARVHD